MLALTGTSCNLLYILGSRWKSGIINQKVIWSFIWNITSLFIYAELSCFGLRIRQILFKLHLFCFSVSKPPLLSIMMSICSLPSCYWSGLSLLHLCIWKYLVFVVFVWLFMPNMVNRWWKNSALRVLLCVDSSMYWWHISLEGWFMGKIVIWRV